MKRHLIHKETNQFWIIETQLNNQRKAYIIRTGTIGDEDLPEKCTSTTTKFDSKYKVKDSLKSKVNEKLKEGYQYFIDIPENLFTDIGDDHDKEGSGPFVVVDFEDKAAVASILEKGLQYVKNYLRSGIRSIERIDFELIYFKEKKTGETPLYQHVDFFDEALKRYPDLEDKVIEWLDYANGLYGIFTEDGRGSYLFEEVASALLSHDKKHIDRFIAYLRTWDWDHETDEESYIFEMLIDRYGPTSDEALKVMAARRLSTAGQHGSELELNEYLEEADQATLDRFFQFMMLDLQFDNYGHPNKRLNDPSHAAYHHEAKQTVDYYIGPILEELGVPCDNDRLVMAVANIDPKNPHKLSDIQNSDYEIPLGAAFCIKLGHEETKKKNYPASIDYFSKAIEKEPENANAFLGRGFAHFCADDVKQAELDWLKSLELYPQSITSNRNLVEVYSIHLPDYPKALKHANQLINLGTPPKMGDYIQRGSIYELMGEPEKAEIDYKKGLTSTSISDHLNYAELKIAFNQFEAAHQALQNEKVIKPQKKTTNYMVIALLLECIALIGLNKDYTKEKIVLERYFTGETVYNKWNFQLLKDWLAKDDLNAEQKEAVQGLIAFVEEKRSMNY